MNVCLLLNFICESFLCLDCMLCLVWIDVSLISRLIIECGINCHLPFCMSFCLLSVIFESGKNMQGFSCTDMPPCSALPGIWHGLRWWLVRVGMIYALLGHALKSNVSNMQSCSSMINNKCHIIPLYSLGKLFGWKHHSCFHWSWHWDKLSA